MKATLGAVVCAAACIALCVRAGFAADGGVQPDLVQTIEAGLAEVDDGIAELEGILGPEAQGGSAPGASEDRPARKHTYYYHRVYYDIPHQGPLPEHDRPGIKVRDYHLPPPVAGERDVYWTMKLAYKFQGSPGGYRWTAVDIHLVRIKTGEDPEVVIQKVLDRYEREARPGGDLHEAFVYDVAHKLRYNKFVEFTAEKVGGPYTSPDDGCEDCAVFYSQAGNYDLANSYRDAKRQNAVRVVWDNPKPDDQMYFIFWE